jgi:hypothetical protein
MTQSERTMREYMSFADEKPFLDKAFERKLEDEDRLRYADVVEPKEPERAEWLRLGVALHARGTEDAAVRARFLELCRSMDYAYVNLLFRDVVLNCGDADAKRDGRRVRFSFYCPKRWETLAPTESDGVRFCEHCNEQVHYVTTIQEAELRAKAGDCIALRKELSDGGVQEDVLGRPDPTRDWGKRLFPRE